MNRANLELTIDRLLLPELPPSQRARIVQVIEQELARLWAERGIPAGVSGESLTLESVSLELPAGASAQVIGVQAAQSIYGELAGASSPATKATIRGV
jgi:hypothetical protein